jgi:hypothetical protein
MILDGKNRIHKECRGISKNSLRTTSICNEVNTFCWKNKTLTTGGELSREMKE